MFSDDVETITMTRQDYDRHMENLIYENVELKQRIDKAIEYIENNIEKIKYKEINTTEGRLYLRNQQIDYLLDILKGSDKEWK